MVVGKALKSWPRRQFNTLDASVSKRCCCYPLSLFTSHISEEASMTAGPNLSAVAYHYSDSTGVAIIWSRDCCKLNTLPVGQAEYLSHMKCCIKLSSPITFAVY